jgi:hypothetical protein
MIRLPSPPVVSSVVGKPEFKSIEFKIPAKLYKNGETKPGEFILRRVRKQIQTLFSPNTASAYNHSCSEWQRALDILNSQTNPDFPIVLNLARSFEYFGWSEDEEESEADLILIALDIGTVQFKKSVRPDLINYLESIIREIIIFDIMTC